MIEAVQEELNHAITYLARNDLDLTLEDQEYLLKLTRSLKKELDHES